MRYTEDKQNDRAICNNCVLVIPRISSRVSTWICRPIREKQILGKTGHLFPVEVGTVLAWHLDVSLFSPGGLCAFSSVAHFVPHQYG